MDSEPTAAASQPHPHGHPHGAHQHYHPGPVGGGRYLAAILLNLVIVAVQLVIGWRIGSAALLADAGHNASDVAGLGVAGVAAWLMARPGGPRRTYGFGKAGILAALLNGLLLLAACGVLTFEAVRRLVEKAPAPPGDSVMAVAGLAVAVNIAAALLLSGGHAHDINRRAAVLHLFADAGVSAAVVVAGFLIWWTGWPAIDPLATLLVVGMILVSTWRLLTASFALALDSVPQGIDPGDVRDLLLELPGVTAVHDLHVWPISATETALTAHLVAPQASGDALLRIAHAKLRSRFGLTHATLQVEESDIDICGGCPDDRTTG
ncbi:cation diffusion facilitator family transporter [Thermaurantiacus sp.]